MPVQIKWVDPEETIIYMDVEGSWSLDEYLSAIQEAIALTKGKTYIVHMIADMTNSRNFPTQVISAAKGYETRFPTNQGLFVFVRMPLYLRTMVQIAIKMYIKTASNLHFADTLDETHRLIAQYDYEYK